MSDFYVGQEVEIIPDPLACMFAGVRGRIVRMGVECLAGMGVVIETTDFGQIKAPYDMIEPVARVH